MPPLTDANRVIRSHNVTASEVGALLGPHPYATPQGIFDRIMAGGELERVETEAMRIGTALEPVIRRLAAHELGVTIHANSRTYQHRRVHLCATPDAKVRYGRTDEWKRIQYGRALVELKASGSRYRWQNGLPSDVEWQARAQMACVGRVDRCIVVVLVGTALHTFVVERELNREHRMTQAVDRYWREHIETGIRPGLALPDDVTVELPKRRIG